MKKKLPIKKAYLGWIICGLAAIFYSYEYFLRISPNVMMAELMQHFQIHAATFGGLAAFYYYAYTPMQLPVGILMDRYGPRRLLTLACFLCVLGMYLFSGGSIVMAALGRFLIGFGSAFAFVGVLKLATIWLPPDRLAMVAGMTSALGTLGGITGEILLTSLVDQIGWRQTIQVSAVFGVFLTVLLWLVLRDHPEKNHAPTISSETVNFKKLFQDLLIIVKKPQIWLNALISALIYFPTTVFAELWGIPYLVHVRQFTSHEAAMGIATLYLGYTIGAPLIGILSDKLHRRRLPIIIGGATATLVFAAILYVPVLPKSSIYGLLFILGLLYTPHVIAFAISRELSPEEASGTAIAVTNMLVMLGPAIFQPVVGILLDQRWRADGSIGQHIYTAEDYQVALSVIPIGLALSAFLALFLKETRGRIQSEEVEK